MISRDRVTFETLPNGTRITYDADRALKGPLRIADLLLGLAFSRVGTRAPAGLERTLAERPASSTRDETSDIQLSTRAPTESDTSR